MWIITVDHIADFDADFPSNANAVGMIGPADANPADAGKCIYPFKMYDDDHNLYYEGKSSEHGSFDPLDDFGEPNAGAAYIKYRNQISGVWEIL